MYVDIQKQWIELVKGTSREDKKLSPYGATVTGEAKIKSILWCVRKAIC